MKIVFNNKSELECKSIVETSVEDRIQFHDILVKLSNVRDFRVNIVDMNGEESFAFIPGNNIAYIVISKAEATSIADAMNSVVEAKP